jgi:putative transposase
VLQVAPSAYRRHAARQRNPELRSARAKRDERLIPHIECVWQTNLQVYGAEKVWTQMNREDIAVARCTVERLMRRLGLQGVRRGKTVRTTIPDTSAPCPLDRVNRQFKADRPNQLWVSDFTYVSTWQGWLYVAFVIDMFARRIVGWRVSTSMTTDFVLDALEQALYDRQPDPEDALIHHSDSGCAPRGPDRLTRRPAMVLTSHPCKLRSHARITGWPIAGEVLVQPITRWCTRRKWPELLRSRRSHRANLAAVR